MSYNNWKSMDKIAIVYEVNDSKLPKAYVTDASDKKSLQSAINWAKGYRTNKEPEIIETDNKDFTISLESAASGSYSQGGKLSFWMCKINKSGIPTFQVGINSDLLFNLFQHSIFNNGVCSEKVEFVRHLGQLGVLHKNMPEYKEMLADIETKNNIKTGKTTKWKPGYVYKTLTQEDVCFGKFSPIITRSYLNDNHYTIFNINLNANAIPIYDYISSIDSDKDKMNDCIKHFCNSYIINENSIKHTNYPSRQQGEKILDIDNNILAKEVLNNIDNEICSWDLESRLPNISLFWNIDPQSCLAKIQSIINNINEDLQTIEDKNENKPLHYIDRFYRHHSFDFNDLVKHPLKYHTVLSEFTKFIIKYNDKTYNAYSILDLYKNIYSILSTLMEDK